MFTKIYLAITRFIVTVMIGMGIVSIIEYGFNRYTILLTTLPFVYLALARFLKLRIKGVL